MAVLLLVGVCVSMVAPYAWSQNAARSVTALQKVGVQRLNVALAGLTPEEAIRKLLAEPDLLAELPVQAVFAGHQSDVLLPKAARWIDDGPLRGVFEAMAAGSGDAPALAELCAAHRLSATASYDLFGNLYDSVSAAELTARTTRVAAIDIGSNNIKITVVDVVAYSDSITINVVHRDKTLARLGYGLGDAGEIPGDKVRLAIDSLEGYIAKAEELGATEIEIIATSALRRATNTSQIIDPVLEATGFQVDVIGGTEEARLILRAAARDVSAPNLVGAVDIGGGSAEIIIGNQQGVVRADSLPLGNQRLAEAVTLDNPPTPEQLDAVDSHIAAQLESFGDPPAISELRATGSRRFADAAHALGLGALTAEGRYVVSIKSVDRLYEHLAGLKRGPRANLLRVDKDQADESLYELAVLRAAMRRMDVKFLHPMRVNLRYGVLVDANAQADAPVIIAPD